MTIYAGEELKVTSTVTNFDGDPLTSGDVLSVKITIWDSGAVPLPVVNDQTMTYDSNTDYWYYMWDTDGLDPGTYKAKVITTGIDNTVSWEWKRLRLARDLITP